jgi:hypothetical protein
MIEIGDYNLVKPTFSLEALENENISLKKQKGQVETILVFVLIAGAYFALKYYETKKEMNRLKTPIILRPNKKT